jgi:hypothetical protein
VYIENRAEKYKMFYISNVAAVFYLPGAGAPAPRKIGAKWAQIGAAANTLFAPRLSD